MERWLMLWGLDPILLLVCFGVVQKLVSSLVYNLFTPHFWLSPDFFLQKFVNGQTRVLCSCLYVACLIIVSSQDVKSCFVTKPILCFYPKISKERLLLLCLHLTSCMQFNFVEFLIIHLLLYKWKNKWVKKYISCLSSRRIQSLVHFEMEVFTLVMFDCWYFTTQASNLVLCSIFQEAVPFSWSCCCSRCTRDS